MSQKNAHLLAEGKQLLGKQTDYPKSYQPKILQSIPRSLARENLPFGLNVGKGFDVWHVYEVSWLDKKDKPHVAIIRLVIPADSPNIVESKSLKLYFNSLNFTRFENRDELVATIQKDIGYVIRAAMKVEIFAVDDFPITDVDAVCIDSQDLLMPMSDVQKSVTKGTRAQILQHVSSDIVTENLMSNLLRSNCPVTDQPDWGTLLVRYEGKQIDKASLLTYICAFREHNGFHEQCVEQVFADILTELKPTYLLVQAWYTRRGGIDINPFRSTNTENLPLPTRLARQ